MSKIKKIAFSIAVVLLAILGFATNSDAYYVGQKVTLTSSQYLNSSNNESICWQ